MSKILRYETDYESEISIWWFNWNMNWNMILKKRLKKSRKKIESEKITGMWKIYRKGVGIMEKLSNLKFELILK